jgi:hypothetical protein
MQVYIHLRGLPKLPPAFPAQVTRVSKNQNDQLLKDYFYQIILLLPGPAGGITHATRASQLRYSEQYNMRFCMISNIILVQAGYCLGGLLDVVRTYTPVKHMKNVCFAYMALGTSRCVKIPLRVVVVICPPGNRHS